MQNIKKVVINYWSTIDGYAAGLTPADRGVTEYHTDKGIAFVLDDRSPYPDEGGLWIVATEPYDDYFHTDVIDALDAKLISEAEKKDSEG